MFSRQRVLPQRRTYNVHTKARCIVRRWEIPKAAKAGKVFTSVSDMHGVILWFSQPSIMPEGTKKTYPFVSFKAPTESSFPNSKRYHDRELEQGSPP